MQNITCLEGKDYVLFTNVTPEPHQSGHMETFKLDLLNTYVDESLLQIMHMQSS